METLFPCAEQWMSIFCISVFCTFKYSCSMTLLTRMLAIMMLPRTVALHSYWRDSLSSTCICFLIWVLTGFGYASGMPDTLAHYIWNPNKVYSRYIPCIFHVYVRWRYMPGIYHVYTMDIKFNFHVFMCNSMRHTNAMLEDNVMLKQESCKKS